MKTGIHPEVMQERMICSSCASDVSALGTVDQVRLDLCSNCHPFYTGKKRIVDTAGRIDRFNQKRAGESGAPVAKSGRR